MSNRENQKGRNQSTFGIGSPTNKVLGYNPPRSKEAKENWQRCNIKGSQAGKITKVIDMRLKK